MHSAGHAGADGPADMSVMPIDFPRTTLNVGALVALALCLSAAVLRIAIGLPLMPLSTYASIAGIEIAWLVGQAILITHQD